MSTLYDIQSNSVLEAQACQFCLLGVKLLNETKQQAVELLEKVIRDCDDQPRSVFLVNAHTLNLAAGDPQYRAILNSGDFVFGDGTGVRWAAKLQGIRISDNLVGTDFIPFLFLSTAGRGYSYYMIGSDEQTITGAAEYARNMFPGWMLSGYHHGYLHTPDMTSDVIDNINSSKPDVLLVGMGNPLQERWICRYQSRLRVPICIGVGGLFDYWAGNVSRAPQWLRRLGHEWIWRLFQQPRDKLYRYMVGNPLFLTRGILHESWSGRKSGKTKRSSILYYKGPSHFS